MTISIQIRTLLFHLATSLHNGLPVSSRGGGDLGLQERVAKSCTTCDGIVIKFLCDP